MTAGSAADLRNEAVGIGAVVTAGFGAAAVLAQRAGLHVACPLRTSTGVPCPGCGMTTVASSLARGDVSGALAADPAGVVLIVLVAAVAVTHLAAWAGRSDPSPTRIRSFAAAAAGRARPSDRSLALLAGGALVTHWATVLLAG